MAVIRIILAEGLGRLKRPLRRPLEHLFWQTFYCLPAGETWIPTVDIFEIPQALWVVVSCPGARRDSFEIRLDGRFLYVKGYRGLPVEGRIYQLEGEYGPFERLIKLPVPVTAEGAEAVFEEGLLRIFLPKSPL
ncbi:MAG: Hsp20/alpha crystallin family protein [Thermodesulfobacteria bacterium]|nr:Hsp20/alpha crystallin family protein [Thermodesulfobacteriota bacterium]